MKNSFFTIPFVKRLLLFVALFVLVSGVTGSWLIGTQQLLFPYYFWIYGSLGKTVLFGLLVLGILGRDQFAAIEVPSWRSWQTGGLLVAGVWVGFFFYSAMQVLALQPVQPGHGWNLLAHAGLVGAVISITSACFPLPVLRSLVVHLKKELILAGGVSLAFWVLLDRVIALWPYLSRFVLSGVVILLQLTHSDIRILPPLTIQLPEFSITIAQYCSGIESLLLLTILYFMIGCLDWKRLIIKRYVLLYSGLVIGMMLVNVVRVYLIIQAGLWFSPQVAAKLFHTYLGMLLFLAYFLVVMAWVYPWVIALPKRKSL